MTDSFTARRWATVFVTLFVAACSVSEDQEVAIGRQNAQEINAKLPIVQDASVADYVQQLGLAIAHTTTRPDLDWRLFVVESKEVNAFALPGGFIYVNRGLFERLLEERRTSPLRIEAFFASHPLEEDRIRDTQRVIESLGPSALRGLEAR